MSYELRVSKSGVNALTATDPNDFIFHSAYNTFKIISEGTLSDSLAATTTDDFTVAHGLDYTPLAHGFLTVSGYSYVLPPNEKLYSVLAGETARFRFNYVETDSTNVIFNLTNYYGSSLNFSIKYYIFEVPL